MHWRRRRGVAGRGMGPWLAGAGVLTVLLALGHGRAAEQASDTDRICSVNLSSTRTLRESLNATVSTAALAKAIQAAHCQAGDILELNSPEADPIPVMAQFCDFGRQIQLYTPSPGYAQVGINSELVCSLVVPRRSSR